MADFLSNFRVPFFSASFAPTLASQGPGALQYSALIVGQKTSAGSGLADALYPVTSAGAVAELAGRGSILHRQAIAWYASNNQTELWIGVLEDDGDGVAAAGTITVTGPATVNGTIALYLGGARYTVGVTVGDTADTIASAINDVIALALDAPITSTVLAAVVSTEFRNAGEVGNSFGIRHRFNDGESLPAGVDLTIVQTTGVT